MGEKQAKRFYPLIGGLFIFILFNNLFALDPRLQRADRTRSRPTPGSRSWSSS